LPCPAQPSSSAEGPPEFIPVPVYHSAAAARTYLPDLFGIPFYVAIPYSEAHDESAIYARLVERYAAWTVQAAQLYKRRVEIAEPSRARSGTPPSDGENKEELEEKDVTEMRDDINEDHDMLPTSREPSEAGEDIVTVLGPQENLFGIKIYPPSRIGGYSYQAHLLNDPLRGIAETLAERAAGPKKKKFNFVPGWSRASTPELDSQSGTMRPLITTEDTILCEWETNMLEFFFGISPRSYKKSEVSLWDQWELFEHPDYVAATKARKATKERGITLDDCLDEFTKEERLGEDDLWYCPRCKKHQQATKKFELWKVPDILVVHLKRFSNSRLLRDKIDAFVDFPIEGLDLSQRVEERLLLKRWEDAGNNAEDLGINKSSSSAPLLYDLFAVDEHLGGLGGGHYRAYAKNFRDETWYHFDDTHVTTSKARESVVRILSCPLSNASCV
jgi:ubiquitin carboxyl-terminal hydrolase 4/11